MTFMPTTKTAYVGRVAESTTLVCGADTWPRAVLPSDVGVTLSQTAVVVLADLT